MEIEDSAFCGKADVRSGYGDWSWKDAEIEFEHSRETQSKINFLVSNLIHTKKTWNTVYYSLLIFFIHNLFWFQVMFHSGG